MKEETKDTIVTISLVVILFSALLLIMSCSNAVAKCNEDCHVRKHCTGIVEYKINGVRIDCLTETHAIEYDWANKWYEGITQALYYAELTGKKPGLVLIKKKPNHQKFINRANLINKKHNLGIEITTINNKIK